jgi:hypothetical protein
MKHTSLTSLPISRPKHDVNVNGAVGGGRLGSGTLEAKCRSHADQLRRLAYVLLAGPLSSFLAHASWRFPCRFGFAVGVSAARRIG